MYTYLCVVATNEKRGHAFAKRTKRSLWESSEERKERGKCGTYIILKNEIILQILFNAYGCFICMYVGASCVCPRRPEEGIRSPWTGVTDGCQLPRGCWELNLCLLEEQLVSLTTDPSLPP